MTVLHSLTDLRNWVRERLLDGTEAEVNAVVQWVQWDSERPHWGRDWENYLSALPEELRDLLAE